MGSIVSRIKYGNITALREQYITVLDYKVFQVCDMDDKLITQLLYNFADNDMRKSGRLDLAEFYQSFELESKFVSPMAKRLFFCFDIDRRGKLSFSQYAVVVFNIALATHKDLLNFVFDCYFLSLMDMNDSTAARVRTIVRWCWAFNIRLANLCAVVSQDGKGHDQRSIRLEMVQTLFSEAFGSKKIDSKSKEVLEYLKSLPYRKQVPSTFSKRFHTRPW